MALFKTSTEAREFLEMLRRKSGGVRPNVWCRVAFGLSLSQESLPDDEDTDSKGQEMPEDVFFGRHRAALMALMRERHVPDMIGRDEVGKIVKLHVERGVRFLRREFEKSGKRTDELVRRLAGRALVTAPSPDGSVAPIHEGNYAFSLIPGENTSNGDPVHVVLNGPGSSPHVAIMGRSGTGKTRLALRMLREASKDRSGGPFLIFDYAKGDIADDSQFVKDTKATVISADRPNSIPIAPLALGKVADEIGVKSAARRFHDTVLSVVSTLGPKQRRRIIDFMQDLYWSHGFAPDLEDFVSLVMSRYEDEGLGDDSLTATLRDLADFPLFVKAEKLKKCPFWDGNYIIDLHRLPEGTRKLAVFLILDALHYRAMRMPESGLDKDGNRKMKLVIVIDEAHNYLPCKQPTLQAMVREVRSKGMSIWLLSQSPDDFDQRGYNFAREMGLAICFACHVDKKKMVETLLGGKIQTEQVTSLEPGIALARIPNQTGIVRMKCWSPKLS